MQLTHCHRQLTQRYFLQKAGIHPQGTLAHTPMGCKQSSAAAGAHNTDGDRTLNRKYISQKSARSTLKPTAKQDLKRTSITGWTILSIDEYYEGMDKDEKTVCGWSTGAELGSGNFGKVFRARNKEKGYPCALKKILMTDKHNSNTVETLRREVNILSEMMHPSIIRLYETLETSTHLYIAQEMCTGGELFDAVIACEGDGGFDERDAAAVLRMAMEGLEHCHSRSVVHRDLKPENFLLAEQLKKHRKPGDPFPQVKMIDFGLAEHHKYGENFQLRAGTPYYMAPEVLNKSYGLECDLWSMGVILYILLSGYPPFYGDTDAEIYSAIHRGVPSNFGNKVESWLANSLGEDHLLPVKATDEPEWADFDEFFPKNEWRSVSAGSIDLIRKLLITDPKKRLTAKQALEHPWIVSRGPRKPSPLKKGVFDSLRKFTGLDKFKKVAKKLIAASLPQKDIEGLFQAFKDADSDGNGVLTADELRVVIHQHLSKPGVSAMDIDEQFAKLIDALDIDGDGTIGYHEFIAATMETKHWATADRLESAFHALDTDGSEYLDPNEIKLALGGDDDDKTVEDIMRRFDKNNDGKIDIHEFKEMMMEQEKKSRQYMTRGSTRVVELP